MLQTAIGEKRNPHAVNALISGLRMEGVDGTLYVGYPVLATADETVFIDALLTSVEFGVVIVHFDSAPEELADPEKLEEVRDDLRFVLYQKLVGFRPLRRGTELSVPVNVVTILPPNSAAIGTQPDIVELPGIMGALKTFTSITPEQLRLVNAAVQRITTIKPPNRRENVQRKDSRGAVMKRIDREIANLDPWQNRAAIESPAGPQRIRGLAGSGKTIVLALKAAYLHARHPDWDIAVTFHTRSLYQQFQDLIRRFVFDQTKDEPNWSKLRVLHSWGSPRQPGVYSEVATHHGVEPKTFTYAKQLYGYERAFGGVCRELMKVIEKGEPAPPLFDAILIDEAQDLPQAFFEIAYSAVADPKRVIWAYDELQNLTEHAMLPPARLFGMDERGRPRVPDLPATGLDEPDQDIILPVCYRNTTWALTIAHALGFGLYRNEGLVQFFDDAQLWSDIGYEVLDGAIAPNTEVSIRRRQDASPAYFFELLNSEDAVRTTVFEDYQSQAQWVADSIHRNLTVDELQARDIMVIVTDPFEARTEAGRLMKALKTHGIGSHLVGVSRDVDEFFADKSIAISGIFRAKGNEAPMVYVLNSEYGFNGPDLIKRRNILFTAITRSRAWVRLCGVGAEMAALREEVNRVIQNGYRLHFRVPTVEEQERLRTIHRDRSAAELKKIQQGVEGITEIVELITRGELSLDVLPPEVKTGIERLSEEIRGQ
jgi:superfamily I DNA and RNA helicase